MTSREQILAKAGEAGIGWALGLGGMQEFLITFYTIAHGDGSASRDAEVAELRDQVTLLRNRLSYILTTRSTEARTSIALANAEENFTDSHIELAAHTKAMIDSSNAEKLAREALIATEIGNDI